MDDGILGLEAIALRLEAMATRVEAIAIGLLLLLGTSTPGLDRPGQPHETSTHVSILKSRGP